MSLKDKYAIVGVGYTPQGKVPARTSLSFHLEACVNAIEDAGLKKNDIDGLICYRHFPASSDENDLTPFVVAQHLGISPKYIYQDANCSRSHLQNAVSVLDSGMCNYVLISFGHNARSSDSLLTMLNEFTGDDAVFGHFGATGGYALAAQRAMHEYHTGPETWKYIAAGQRKWACLNPEAIMYGKPLTFEDYLNYKWFVEPFRLPDNCLLNDGGRAVIITSLERARDLKQPPAVIMGIGGHHPSTDIKYSTSMAGPTGAKKASEDAFKMAGISINDVDACEIYDCFTYTVEITLQDYGFFGPGEGEDWFKGGTIEPGGSMPVNTSGGLLSEAYYMGLTPLSEAAMQIMGRCGQRQLGPQTKTKSPEIILCSDNGAILQSHLCYILRTL
jgi:acetyl-CoA acetyltransferase